jgi:ABC-2 type transport system ATP-binding protein
MKWLKVSTKKKFAIQFLQGRIRYKDFDALRNVSLQMRKGEVIGNTGAVKNILLKVVSRVLIPVQGQVSIKGKVSPML